MSKYIQVEFNSISPTLQDVFIALLQAEDYEGFEQAGEVLRSYCKEEKFNEEILSVIAGKNKIGYTVSLVEETNWNKLWESNFQPVIIDDFVCIRADFHDPVPGVEHNIIINPKMSFGTGHHATTNMMIRQMRRIVFSKKTVIDFGTGTGILAILAEKLGAASVVAIDNDDWSIQNASENLANNNCHVVQVLNAGILPPGPKVDIILANINKNVILDNFFTLIEKLHNGGILLLSGLLEEDELAIQEQVKNHSLRIVDKLVEKNWICMRILR